MDSEYGTRCRLAIFVIPLGPIASKRVIPPGDWGVLGGPAAIHFLLGNVYTECAVKTFKEEVAASFAYNNIYGVKTWQQDEVQMARL